MNGAHRGTLATETLSLEPKLKYKGEYNMASRTPEGKHVTRFIVLKKALSDEKFVRSYNIPEFFATREEAQAAIVKARPDNQYVQYKVRQK
jgi:hypothetical protein